MDLCIHGFEMQPHHFDIPVDMIELRLAYQRAGLGQEKDGLRGILLFAGTGPRHFGGLLLERKLFELRRHGVRWQE